MVKSMKRGIGLKKYEKILENLVAGGEDGGDEGYDV